MDSLLVSGLKDMHEHGAEKNEHVDEVNKTDSQFLEVLESLKLANMLYDAVQHFASDRQEKCSCNSFNCILLGHGTTPVSCSSSFIFFLLVI